ncbi:glycosyltransferase family 2 protein [Oenococcus sp.]|uniref:glycosyltransferase family 2 protein n=1 Tax=Oenococcus sp. TaxID=1979414 RepID=UPI0039EA748D
MIDVVVPIFAGFQQTKRCLRSIMTVVNQSAFRLILVDDRTPDAKIRLLLLEFEGASNVQIIHNASNLGFSKSINIGFHQSKNDVIILNSDTVVNDHWIDYLREAAYSKSKIGTATALTNKGTIVSVPKFNQDSELPCHITPQRFSDLLLRITAHKAPAAWLPTCIGHCVYIKRQAISAVGGFDERIFASGYGEEVDFSQRIKKFGWQNAASLKTFVYHSGSASFKGHKQIRTAEHKKIIDRKYPLNRLSTRLFILLPNPIKRICHELQKELIKTPHAE